MYLTENSVFKNKLRVGAQKGCHQEDKHFNTKNFAAIRRKVSVELATLNYRTHTGLFKMIVGDLTTCHTQYT